MGKGGKRGKLGGIAPWLLGDRRPCRTEITGRLGPYKSWYIYARGCYRAPGALLPKIGRHKAPTFVEIINVSCL